MALVLRKFFYEEILPEAEMFEDNGKYPTLKVYQKLGSFGILLSKLGPGKHIK